MKRSILFIVGISLIAGSCANWNTAYRESALGQHGRVITVDAKQRFLITADKVKTIPSDRKDVDPTIETLREVCAEPSPDVFSVLSASMEGSVKYKDKASADFKAALSEAAATIGIRTETIQLLRDAMFRVCELGMNGQLTPTAAVDLHRHYQKSMVTLAAVSALADTTRPTQVGISSRATVTRGALMAELTKEIGDTQKEQSEQTATQTAANEALATASKNVSEGTVTDNSCEENEAKCVLGRGESKLEDAEVGSDKKKAVTETERQARAKSCCGNAANKTNDLCVAFAKATTDVENSTTNVDNTAASLKKLQADLDAVKQNSDLGAMTEIVRLAPTTVQPSHQNVQEVAGVVRTLVTQVYASDFVDRCLSAMIENREVAPKAAAAAERVKVLTEAIESRTVTIRNFAPSESQTSAKLKDLTSQQQSDEAQLRAEEATVARAKELAGMVEFCGKMTVAFDDGGGVALSEPKQPKQGGPNESPAPPKKKG